MNKNILWCSDNILETDMQTIAIPVNTMGFMGKGLAFFAKNRYPHIEMPYKNACLYGELTTSTPIFLDSGDEKCFIFFATKEDWRKPSKLEYVEKGMYSMATDYLRWNITSLAMPALGCGLGGLSWSDVKPIMLKYLYKMTIPIAIYTPQ